MAPQHEIIDLTESDDDQPTTSPPRAREGNAEIISLLSDDEDEDDINAGHGNEDDQGNNEDLVGPLLAALAGAPEHQRRTARAPIPATPHHNIHVRGAEVVLHLFADGSFISQGFGGAGVSYRDHRNDWHGRAVALGRVKDSFTAELHAILEGVKTAHAIVDGRPEVTKVIIQSDCESCLTALARARAAGGGATGLLEETLHQEALLKSRNLEVHAWWVKGHSDSVGNDIADDLARYGAERARTSPAHWGMVVEDPPSGKLELANALRHGDRKPRPRVVAPQERHARKEAMRRARRQLRGRSAGTGRGAEASGWIL